MATYVRLSEITSERLDPNGLDWFETEGADGTAYKIKLATLLNFIRENSQNKWIQVPGYTVDEINNEITVDTSGRALIGGNIVNPSGDTVVYTPIVTAGISRIDALVYNTSNSAYELIQGAASADPTTPGTELQGNYIFIAYLLVDDTGVEGTSVANEHAQNTDTALAQGTANEVTAAQLRNIVANGMKVLSDFAGVTLADQDGKVIQYDHTSGKFVFVVPSSGSGGVVENLTTTKTISNADASKTFTYEGATDLTVTFPNGIATNKMMDFIVTGEGNIVFDWGGSIARTGGGDMIDTLSRLSVDKPGLARIMTSSVLNRVTIISEDMTLSNQVLTPDEVLGLDSIYKLSPSTQTGWTVAGAPTIGASDITFDGVDDAYYIDLPAPTLDKAMIGVVEMPASGATAFRFGFCDDGQQFNTCFARIELSNPYVYIRTESNGVNPGDGTTFDPGNVTGGFSPGDTVLFYLEMTKAGPQILEMSQLNTTTRSTLSSIRNTAMDASNAAYTGLPRISFGCDYRGTSSDIFAPGKLIDGHFTNKLSTQKRADLWQAYKTELGI